MQGRSVSESVTKTCFTPLTLLRRVPEVSRLCPVVYTGAVAPGVDHRDASLELVVLQWRGGNRNDSIESRVGGTHGKSCGSCCVGQRGQIRVELWEGSVNSSTIVYSRL